MHVAQGELCALVAHEAVEPVEAGIGPARMLAVGPAGDFHLQQAHLDPHLEHFAPVLGADQPRRDHSRSKRPFVKDGVDVVWFRHGPILLRRFRWR